MNWIMRSKEFLGGIVICLLAASITGGAQGREPSPQPASQEAIVAASTFLPEGAPEAVNRWAKITGGAGTKTAAMVRETADGGIVYDGETNAYGASGTDFLLFKVDSSGSPVWANRYGTASDDGGASQPTDDGGYIVAGWTMTPPATSSSWLMKLDASGAISWQKNIALAAPMGQTVLGVSKILSDGYLLTGIGIDFQSFSIATILIKTDLSGNIVWQKTYSLPGYSLQVQSVVRLTDGSLVLGGMATNSSTMDSDLCVVKLTATGDLVWANTYGGPAQEVGGTGLILTTDNGFILQGETKSWGMGGTVDGLGDIWFVKLDSSGNIQWQYAYGGTGDEAGLVMPDSGGGYFVGATTTSFGAGKEDLWAVKLNATGQITWQKTYGGAEDDYGAVLFDPSGSGYLLSATTLSFGAGGRDEWMAKLDASGNIVWQNTYGTGLEEEGAGFRTTSGDILIQGHSKLPSPPTPTVSDAWFIHASSVGDLGTSCPFIQPGLGVMGTGAGVATATTATPVSAPVIVGTASFATSPGGVAATGITLPLTDLCSAAPGCTLSCTATVPATGATTSAVSFASTATASNCTGTPTFDWNFGDGTAHSTAQNPTHTYATAGNFGWSLAVSVDGVPCSKSGTINISGGGGASTLAIGTGSGTAGASVCVDLTLTNSGTPVITAFTTDITYDASMLAPTGVTTPVGGKIIGGNIVSAGTYRITLYGGTGTLANGTVANVCFATTAGQCATYPLGHAAGTPTASDASANPVAITGTEGSITTTGCSGCTLSCTATVPATGTTTSAVAFASTATPSNCAGTPTFDWDFGDGTAHSTSQNPSHTYASAGTFNWALAVSVNGVPCSKSGSITISGGGGGSGTPWAWGYNSSGQLGDGTTTDRLSPVAVSGLSSASAFEAGEAFSLALKADGTLAAWGYNFFGQLGNGTYNNSSIPVSVSSLTGVTAIAAGRNFALARKNDGSVWAWGHNSSGQIGGSGSYSNVPILVSGISGASAIACGEEHSIALKGDGTVWTWGSNYYGQLGNGSSGSGSNPTPQQVTSVSNIVDVKAGYSYCLALKSDGTVWAWGYNYNGQLGDGTTTQRNLPVQVSGISNITAIAAGYAGALARKGDGTVWAWGWNGASTESHVPVQVASLANATQVAAGYLFAMVLESDGTVWTWGRNTHGQLGDGTLTWHDSPVQVTGLGYALSIAAGDYHALATTGTAPCVLTCTATVPATGVTGAAVSFAASATLTGCTGTPTYAWTFGDGGTSNLQNPTHTYSAAGPFNWTLDVSAASQTCSKSGSIVVATPLSASASSDKSSGTAPLAVAFTGSASGGVAPYTYSWTLGDGSTSTAQNPAHTFTQAGSFTAVLTVTDSASHSTQAPGVTITVTNPVAPPVVTLIKKVSPPFKLSVMGSNLQNGIKVYIDGTQWTSVLWKKPTKILLTGAIKTAVPKGTTKTFRFVNPDGGEATMTWGW